jgi:outer membrane protein assembly factor BamD
MIRRFLFRNSCVLLLFVLVSGCGSRYVPTGPASDLDEPDRVLYDRAMTDLYRNRYTIARLTLQTLINTYPDSEYLPQAKYALAESFYREGTSSALTQSETEFKDYITFFPTTDLADDAQLMVAMTHVRLMEKPDRDSTQALLAESELKKMIDMYPDSPLLNEAKGKLREVQDVLAEGVFRIGNHYFLRRSYPASTGRYKEILQKYPDYVATDEVLFRLAESLRRNDNEPESAIYYARVITDFPMSERAAEAKGQLTAMNLPIPDPNPVALARAQTIREGKGLLGKMMGMFGRRPDVSTETSAASVQDEAGQAEAQRNGTFTIEPQVVEPAAPR